MRRTAVPAIALATSLLAAAACEAQNAPSAPAAPVASMAKVCQDLPAAPEDGRELAMRSQCVLTGALASSDRINEARVLARKALALGEPGGGYMLWSVFNSDPANRYVRDGKVDMDAYTRLAQRPLEQRREQVEAIEGLGVAASKGSMNAGLLLASYFHETVAPGNVTRVRALASVLRRGPGERPALLQALEREAAAIEKAAPGTRTSVRSFLDAYQSAVATAVTAYKSQAAGKSCDKPTLKSVSAGDIASPEYLPLKGTMVAGSYLVKGAWSEYWTFDACGEDVPVVVKFQADGWGGATYAASYNKGE